jgi:hypothetical protein
MNSSASVVRNGRTVIDFVIAVALIAMLGAAVHHHVGDMARGRQVGEANATSAEDRVEESAAQAPTLPAASAATDVTLRHQLDSLAGEAAQ